MKKRIILWGVIIVTIIIGISISLNRVDTGGELDDFNMEVHPGLEWMRVTKTSDDQKVHTGQWMTLEDVIKLAKKKEQFSGKNLWDYQYYTKMTLDTYYRIYEIADFDMLFELHVSWSREEYEEYNKPDNIYYINDMEVQDAILTAKDGLDTYVDIRFGDVEAYINEHQNNPGYKKFGFLYFPIDVEAPEDTAGKITKLIEEGETFVVSSPEELVAVKIDSEEELYSFLEETQNEVMYSDKATSENLFYEMVLMTNTRNPEPQFLLYIPEGNSTHKYSVTYMEKHGKDKLYITLKKEPRGKYEEAMKGCLIGLRILKDSDEPSTIKEVTTIYIDIEE